MTNAAERSDVKLLEKLARQKAAQSAEVLKGIMSNAFGRQWMLDLLERSCIGRTPFVADPYATAFNCGQQNLGLQLLADIQTHCPEQYTLAMQEANERNITLDIALANQRSSANGHVDSDDAGGGDNYYLNPADGDDRSEAH